MPHLIKTAFVFFFSLQKSNQNSEYKAKFNINLFKLIIHNFSSDYTLAVEFYFKKQGFPLYSNEFISMIVKFESLNMIISKQSTKKYQTNIIIFVVFYKCNLTVLQTKFKEDCMRH